MEETDVNELSETEEYNTCTKITSKDSLGYIHKRETRSNFACQEIQTSNRATKILSFKINPIFIPGRMKMA